MQEIRKGRQDVSMDESRPSRTKKKEGNAQAVGAGIDILGRIQGLSLLKSRWGEGGQGANGDGLVKRCKE